MPETKIKAVKKAADLKKANVEKPEKKAEKAVEKKKTKKIYARKAKTVKSAELKKSVKKIAKKRRKYFHGRFGKNSIRRKNIAKWQKWHYPRGGDLEKTKQYICMPSSGWRSMKATRGLHPSGYSERIVCNVRELEMLAKEKDTVAARISGTTGGKKRAEIIRKANELGIRILN